MKRRNVTDGMSQLIDFPLSVLVQEQRKAGLQLRSSTGSAQAAPQAAAGQYQGVNKRRAALS
jgi:hypothetical protein